MFKNIYFLALQLNDILAGYNILGPSFLSFRTLQMLFSWLLLVLNTAMEKSEASLIFPPCYVVYSSAWKPEEFSIILILSPSPFFPSSLLPSPCAHVSFFQCFFKDTILYFIQGRNNILGTAFTKWTEYHRNTFMEFWLWKVFSEKD